MKYFLILLFSIFSLSISAQNPLSVKTDTSFQSYIFFCKERIKQNISLLRHRKNDFSEDYLLKISELRNGRNNINELENIRANNSEHPYSKYAQYYEAKSLFYQGEDDKARDILASLKENQIFNKEYANYYFMKGYFALEDKNFKSALTYFDKAQNSGMNTNEVTYYQGFCHYYTGNDDAALTAFDGLLENEKYSPYARYFIAEINYENKKYDEVIEVGEAYATNQKSTINAAYERLIGESYIKKNNVRQGAIHLEKSIKLHTEKPTSALYYQTAVAKLKSGEEADAIEYFKKSGIGSNEFSSLSAFQLGRIYLNKKQYENALSAFENVTQSSDKKIQESSIYQVTKINAKVEKYEAALQSAGDYLQKFPKGQWKTEIQNLTANLYLKSSNYDLAIKFLDKLDNLTNTQKAVYQKVAFQKAQLLFNDSDFSNSINWFTKSKKHPLDKQLVKESNFYIAEALSTEKKYQQAIQFYKKSNQNALTNYGLGYAYYNLEAYKNANFCFAKALKNLPKKYQNDAKLRKGDCQYALKNYSEALALYQSVDADFQKDYLSYQKAEILGVQNKIEEAVIQLDNINQNSYIYPKSLLLKADLLFKNGMFNKAEDTYNQIVKSNDDNEILAQTYHNRAVCKANNNKLKSSEKDYKLVIEKYPTSKYAFSSILGLQALEQKGLNVTDFDAVKDRYKAQNPENGSLEMIDFEAAKSKYFDQKYVSAISSLKKFIKEYPKSSNVSEAKYFLADAYYRSEDFENAKLAFEDIKNQRSRYTGRILNRLGEVNANLGNYEEAIKIFTQLKSLNLTPKDNYFANFGNMKAYFELKKYNQTIQKAQEIIQAEWKPINAIQKASIYQGKSYLALKKYNKALETYKKISDDSDIYAAEASYFMAFIQYKQSKYDESLESLFALNNTFGSYAEWIDKSYLLIADNYQAKGEDFQAQATLKSIVEHTENEAVKKEAQARLEAIEKTAEKEIISDTLNAEDEK